MDYVHRCVICEWQRSAASPAVTSPRCENCGCALESVPASEMVTPDHGVQMAQIPERFRSALVRMGGAVGAALLFFAAARTGYTEGGVAMAVTAIGAAGLVVVMATAADRA